MHYKNGREAKIGDLVRGRGYNLKHEFTGILLDAHPELTSCNFTVVTVSLESPGGIHLKSGMVPQTPESFITKEYGQLDALVAIDPATGEELPAEAPAPSGTTADLAGNGVGQ